MKICKALVRDSALAGLSIGIGGAAYLATGWPWIFPIGLFIVCYYSLNLFTGKICYIDNIKAIPKLVVMYTLNSVAAYVTGLIVIFSRPDLFEKVRGMVDLKLSEGWRLIPLAILCNLMIFIAVNTYNVGSRKDIGLFGLVLATTVFVACGFEHCIANAFYFGAAREFSVKGLLYLLANGFFNAIGGIAARWSFNWHLITVFKEGDENLGI